MFSDKNKNLVYINFFNIPKELTNINKKYDDFISFVKEIACSKHFKNQSIKIQSNIKINNVEFDIYWENSIFNTITKYAIECKEYGKQVDVENIEAFAAKMKNNNIKKGIFVTKTGFHSECYKISNRMGIDLLDIKDIEEYKKSRVLSVEKLNQIEIRRYIKYPKIYIESSKSDNYKLIELEKCLEFGKSVFVKKGDCEPKLFLDYIKQLIEENSTKETENILNCISKKYSSNSLFVYKDINDQIPITAISIEYIFKNITYNTKYLVHFDFYNSIISEIDKINVSNPNSNIVTYN